MKKPSEVFKNIRFAKGEKRDKPHLSTDDEEHGAVGEVEWNQQLDHQKKRAMQEEEQLDEKNEPTNPSLWSRAKALARSKFDVYPSAYANGWASKWYKSKGGGWKTVSEEKDMKSARIIKDLYKKKGVSDKDKWKEEYKKARAAGSSSSNAKARANGAVYEEITIEEEIAGWIAHYNGQKHEIKKHEAKDLYDAKQKAIAHFKAPKSKHGLIAVKPAYNEEVEQVEEGAFKRIATDREEDARLAKSKSWKKETPWMKVKNVVTDKSGAKHGPMSRARDLARKAAIVKEAADKAKAKKKEKKVSDDTYQAEPELSSQIIRND